MHHLQCWQCGIVHNLPTWCQGRRDHHYGVYTQYCINLRLILKIKRCFRRAVVRGGHIQMQFLEVGWCVASWLLLRMLSVHSSGECKVALVVSSLLHGGVFVCHCCRWLGFLINSDQIRLVPQLKCTTTRWMQVVLNHGHEESERNGLHDKVHEACPFEWSARAMACGG